MQASVRLESLPFDSARTYLYASLFIIGNMLLPQMCHLLPQGGNVWLPIYFFTLTGAYCYGWRVGLLTAVASPLVNSVLFGMPGVAVLPAIMLKSVLLAVIAGLAASRFRRVSIALLAGVVLVYQVLGTLGEWAIIGDFKAACADFRLGVPGMLAQIAGGWIVINKIIKRQS